MSSFICIGRVGRLVWLTIALSILVATAHAQLDLTGTWTADDGSIYYVRQLGNTIWWAGMSTESPQGMNDFHKGLAFTNIFRGQIMNNVIAGEWADVPRGQNLGSGRLALDIVASAAPGGIELRKRAGETTGGFGPSVWQKVIGVVIPHCETESSPIRCKFARVRKNVGGTLLEGGDLKPYKDNVVVFGTTTSDLHPGYPPLISAGRSYEDFMCRFTDDDGDITFNAQIERVNNSGTGLDQGIGAGSLSRFWMEGWVPGVQPDDIRAKLDRHVNKAHVEVIMYGRTGIPIPVLCRVTDPGEALLPGWAETGANSVLLNGRPLNGEVLYGPFIRTILLGREIPPGTRVRITGALVIDCGHQDCEPPDPGEEGVEIHPVYSLDIVQNFALERPNANLTGVWAANDEGTYYVHQVSNTIWWLGLSRDQGRTFANVFQGTIQGNAITGDWADVPVGSIENNGRLSLLLPPHPSLGPLSIMFVKDAPASTGGFGAQLWEKLYDR
jgi:hypothetical protein